MEEIGIKAILHDEEFQKGLRSYIGGLDKAESRTSQFGSLFKGVMGGLGGIAQTALGFFTGQILGDVFRSATQAIPDMISKASDLNETISKVGIVFGDWSEDILHWGETSAKSLGMSQNAALAAAGTYGNLFRSMGIGFEATTEMSTGLVELAADLASFNNMDPTLVLEKLRAKFLF